MLHLARNITCGSASVATKGRKNNLEKPSTRMQRVNLTHRKFSQKTPHGSQTDAPTAHEAP